MDLTADLETDTASGSSLSNIEHSLLAHQDDLIGFLSLMQAFGVRLLPITWQPALGALGKGGTASISQAVVNAGLSYAFKRMRQEKHLERWVTEVIVSVLLRKKPNIVNVEAYCLEILGNGQLCPVLVFEKANHGDLERFMRHGLGKCMSTEEVLHLCLDIGRGIMHMHSSSKMIFSSLRFQVNLVQTLSMGI